MAAPAAEQAIRGKYLGFDPVKLDALLGREASARVGGAATAADKAAMR
jgi:hypothetical protein